MSEFRATPIKRYKSICIAQDQFRKLTTQKNIWNWKKSTNFKLISSKGSEESLWLGSKTLNWLLSALNKHKGSSKVKNIAIVIGTNGAFNSNDNISGLIDELKLKFPNANLFVVQGSWGWGGLTNMSESKVRKYYNKFKDLGVTVIEPPIGKIEPHGNKPVYKTIGASLDSKV